MCDKNFGPFLSYKNNKEEFRLPSPKKNRIYSRENENTKIAFIARYNEKKEETLDA